MAAVAGQEGDCRHALDLAALEIADGPGGDDLPYLALNPVHFARWRGSCLIHFGDPETGSELAAALDAMHTSSTRAEAGLPACPTRALPFRRERHAAPPSLPTAAPLLQPT